MELRKTEEKEIIVQDVTVRHLANEVCRLKTGTTPVIRAAGTGAKAAAYAVKTQAKKAAMTKEGRIARSELPPEQRKQWDSYSSRQQIQILQEVSRKTERRMQYRTSSDTVRSTRRRQPDIQRYRLIQRQKKRPSASPVLLMPAVKRATVNPVLRRNMLHELRQARAKKRFQSEPPHTPKLRQTADKGGFAAAGGKTAISRLRPVKYRTDPDRQIRTRAATLSDELALLASGKGGHRRTVCQTDMRTRQEKKTVFYEPDDRKAQRKAGRIGHSDTRQAARAKKQQKQLFKSELIAMLDRDGKKTETIKRVQRGEQIEMSISDLERENSGSILRTVALPVRIPLAALKAKAAAMFAHLGAILLKYAVVLLLPVLLFGFFLLVIGGILGSLAGSEAVEDQYSSAYSVSGYQIVEYAKEWIGITKYVWGAGRASAEDWQDFADCSSFAQGVYAHFGYQIGGTTYVQEASGTVVDGGLADAVPGDLILFYSGSIAPGNSSHVGIYAGDGQMVHCSGGSSNTFANPGRGVCMGSVTGDGRPFEVRRIVPLSFGGGEELLSHLAKYNTRLEQDKAQGIKWFYTNRGAPASWNAATASGAKKASNCALLVRWALKEMGVIESDDFFYYTYGNTFKWENDTEANLRANADIIEVRRTARSMIADSTLQPGDICCWHSMQHINVYAGGNLWYDAGRGGSGHWENFGHLDSDGWEDRTYVFDKWGPVPTGYMDTQVDYIIRIPSEPAGGVGATSGHARDTSAYTQEQIELIWAIVGQEDRGSYEGALAVISSAMNRTESPQWRSLGNTALAQLTASGQYCYSNDTYWHDLLDGNVPDYVKTAVNDCLKKGIRNHSFTSFRSKKGSQTGADAVQIGGNWFFGS